MGKAPKIHASLSTCGTYSRPFVFKGQHLFENQKESFSLKKMIGKEQS